jgi:cysteine-rich repeat protein
VVTVLFVPPTGDRNATVLAESCAAVDLAACAAALGGGTAGCVPVNGGGSVGLAVTDANELQFRFPDTDARLAAGACPGDPTCNDDRTFSGPAKIVVTRRGAPLPCGLATQRCADLGGTTASNGVIACVDELFELDGTCRSGAAQVDETFGDFAALPPPNDFGQLVAAPGVTELRFTTDASGNLLLPMDYTAVLLRVEGVPVPQLARGTTSVEAFLGGGQKIDLLGSSFLGSYSPEGIVLPPFFTPLSDPSLPSDAILFGSIDAPRGVIRIARQACVGGDDEGTSCTQNGDCSSAVCSAPLFDFSTRYASGVGPIVLPGGANLYSAELESPVPLEGLTQGPEALAFVLSEAVDAVDRNGDADPLPERRDFVVTVRDEQTGAVQPIGPGGSDGRAVVRLRDGPFAFPAVETRDDLVAFLESEPAQGNFDTNGNGDVFDSILRLFRLDPEGPTDLTPAGPPTADASAAVNGRSLGFADAYRLLLLTREAREADQATSDVATAFYRDSNFFYGSWGPSVSADGRYVAFASSAANLVAGDTNLNVDVFVRDQQSAQITRVSVGGCSATQATGGSAAASISADGRYVAFVSSASNLVAGDTNTLTDVFVHDRATGCTTRAQGLVQPNGRSYNPSISTDGAFVAFDSDATNLGGDANAFRDVFIWLNGTTTVTVASRASGWGPALGGSFGAISADGRFVSFVSPAGNLVQNDNNETYDVFVRDLSGVSTSRVNVSSLGEEANDITFYEPSISRDGRFVAFSSLAENLVPGDTNGMMDIFVHDRQSGETTRASVSSSGEQGNNHSPGVDFDGPGPAVSPDGRFVAFVSSASNLVAGDPGGGVYVHDRVTVETRRSGSGAGASSSAEGAFVAFASTDVFVRGPDPADLAADRSGDTRLDDTVLRVVDASAGPPASITDLCPADAVAVAGGRAAFLRPESAGESTNAGCTGPTLTGPDLNGDFDEIDRVVHLWNGASVSNLRCAATAVELSETRLAALVSEEGVFDFNLDGDGDDAVAHVRSPTAAAGATCDTSGWLNISLAGTAIGVSGDHVAVLASEVDQAADLNGDGDTVDTVLHLVDGSTGQLHPQFVPTAAEEFVLGSTLVAFRTSEGAQSSESPPDCSLNGDDDCGDAVLQVADLATGVIVSSGQAAVRCELSACDPRRPYRVSQDTVRFLTLEAQQGQDLNDDGDQLDLLVQVMNVQSGGTEVVAEATDPAEVSEDAAAVPTSDPTAAPSEDDPAAQSSQVLVARGRCVEDSLLACTVGVPGTCASGTFCFAPSGQGPGTCVADTGRTCRPDAPLPEQGCTPGATCVGDLAVLAVADHDADQVPDALDNCSDAANTNQADADQDGVGDVCDLETCGNTIVEIGEECDDGDLVSGDGCDANCRDTACGNGILAAGEACDDGNLLAGDGCSPSCQIETACSDGVDNDGDGLTDYLADPGCTGGADSG